MRLFAQLSWYFRREWRRYLGAIALLAIIAVLQLIPPKVVGIVVDGVTRQHYTAEKVWMWIGALVLIAVMVYLLRYVWRVLLFGASYQLAVELREDFYRQLSRQHPAFYLRHRTGDLIARATNDVDRVVFAAGGAGDQRGGAQVVHGIQRVPGRLVADAGFAGCAGDRAGGVDSGQQAHLAGIGQLAGAVAEDQLAMQVGCIHVA